MSEQVIAASAADFLAALNHAGHKLQDFSQELNRRDNDIADLLTDFAKSQSAMLQEANNLGDTAVDKALHHVFSDLQEMIEHWQERAEERRKSQNFMHEHEKYLVVMVFGAVKSGKSTLGNFLAGREWLKAPFDNAYKHMPPTEFTTQEQARETGGLTTDADGRTWFKEGVIDTTGDIQYFTLSGLRWFDSPGTGAIEKDDDKRNMEEMVNEYLKYVDFCVFLINSSEPGLMDDMKYIKRLERAEQEALIVITKSDTETCDVDLETGEIITKKTAKTPEDRHMQETDMCKRLHKEYPELDSERYHAMSLSTYLAQEALKDQDEQEYEDSHLDLFMQRLASKAKGNVVALKMKGPKRALNQFLRELTEGDEQLVGTKGLREKLQLVQQPVIEFRETIDKRTGRLARAISKRVRSAAQREVTNMSRESDKTGRIVNSKSIAHSVFQAAQPIIEDTINAEISKIIGTNQDLTDQLAINVAEPDISTADIRRHIEEVKHEYTVQRVVHRDPDGVWENIRHFFGKEYYGTVNYKRTYTTKVNLGTNVDEVLDELMPQVDAYVTHTVRENLMNLSQNYFAQQEKAVQAIESKLDELEQKLDTLRYE